MCGRTALSTPPEELRELFELEEIPPLSPRYNIAPTQPIPILRMLEGRTGRRIELLRWGLVPAGSIGASAGAPLINIRRESLGNRPPFRDALRRRRCLVIVDGFFEWRHEGRRTNQPYFIHRTDRKPFALAALWEKWVSRDGEVIESCAVVTAPAAPPVDPIHDRMPLVMPRESYATWLDPHTAEPHLLEPLLHPAPPADLVAEAVSTRVNSPVHDDIECIAPAKDLKLF
jgi:putative SOS response-associated peptidase YedK